MRKIAIIGATGMMGQPVVYEFIDAGYSVSVFARSTEKAKRMFGPLVEIFEGNLENINDIREFIKGHEMLYLNLSVDPDSEETGFQPERDGLKNILRATKNSGIIRIGYLSSLMHRQEYESPTGWWVSDIKKNAVFEIRASNPSYTIFYPSVFMESFHKGYYRYADRIKLIGKSKYPRHLISGSDYGKQVVRAFEIDTANHHYIIQGPEALFPDQAAVVFAENYTKSQIKITSLSFSLLKLFGKFNRKTNYTANMIWVLNNYPEEFEAEKTWNQLGKPQTTFRDYSENI